MAETFWNVPKESIFAKKLWLSYGYTTVSTLYFRSKCFLVFAFLFSNLSRFGFVLKNFFLPLFVQF